MKAKLRDRRGIALAAAVAITPWLAAACSHPPAEMPAPQLATVSGPIAGGDKGWIYRSPVLDLKKHGYVIEEFFVSGMAHAYELAEGAQTGSDGNWQTEAGDTRPFTTRVFILRPEDPAKYNGVLLAHWQNVSAGYENGYPTGDEIFKGYAWMAVSAQADGVYGTPRTREFSLKEWDATRYGALDHPGDRFSYDIFAKAVSAALARSESGPGGPLGDLKTNAVIAMGGSQSAWRLATYINAAHQHDKVFDGFLLLVHFGVAMPPDEVSIPELLGAGGNGRKAHSTPINDRGDVPVLVINSQAEALENFPARQPDTDSFRFWEIAGAPHTPPSTITMKSLTLERDGIPSDAAPGQNIVEWDYVKDAGIRAIAKWVQSGEAPPRFDPIAIVATENGPVFELDEAGNVRGGIRPPEVAAPVGLHTAGRPNLLGRTELFDDERMRALHGTRDNFVASWNAAVDRLVESGLILPGEDSDVRARALDFWK